MDDFVAITSSYRWRRYINQWVEYDKAFAQRRLFVKGDVNQIANVATLPSG